MYPGVHASKRATQPAIIMAQSGETITYAELEENDVDLKKLQGWLAKIRKLDFYGGARAAEAEERLKGCEAVLDDYARRVFDAHDENG